MDIFVQLILGYQVLISSWVCGYSTEFPEPMLYSEPEKITVDTWDRVTMNCAVKYLGDYQITWLRGNGDVIWTSYNGTVIDNESFRGSGEERDDSTYRRGWPQNFILNIYPVLKDYAGNYTCSVNTLPIQQKLFTLEVLYGPVLTNRPECITVNTSSDAIFECSADGNPTPSITWDKRHGELPHERSTVLEDNSLYISDVQLSDYGEYRCLVENSQNSMYVSGSLVVQVSPYIINPPMNTTVIAGQNAKLMCRFGGNPEPEIVWRKQGSKENSSVSADRFLYKNGILTIKSIHKKDEGIYLFDAVNILGYSTARAMLKVEDTPAEITLDGTQHNVTVTEGLSEQATLPCNITYRNSSNEVKWMNHYNITVSGVDWRTRLNFPRTSLTTWPIERTVHLSIAYPTVKDAGIYRCSVTTSPEEENVVVLTVLAEPVVTTLPDDQDVFINMDVMFPCEASGFPIPNITWIKIEGNLPKGRHEVYANNSLLINNLTKSDQGTYVCRAENTLQAADAVAKLLVLIKPSLFVTPEAKLAEVGDDVYFQCVAHGNPQPYLEWFKDGEGRTNLESEGRYIIDQTRGILSISNVGREDEGHYICRGSNKAGQAEAGVTFGIVENDNSQKNNEIIKLLNGLRDDQKRLDAEIENLIAEQNKTNSYIQSVIAHESEQ